MNRYQFELAAAVVLLAAYAAVWHWQAPGDTLTQTEIAQYLNRIDAQVSINAAEKADLLARLRDFGNNDDGRPAYMVNLMRYYEALRTDSGIPVDFAGTPAQANAHYESNVMALAWKSGSMPLFAGNVHERNVTSSCDDEDRWSRVVLMRYPSRRAVFELFADPVYAKYLPFKLGSLHVALVPAASQMVIPEVRFLAGAAVLIVFLAIGWACAVRRAAVWQPAARVGRTATSPPVPRPRS